MLREMLEHNAKQDPESYTPLERAEEWILDKLYGPDSADADAVKQAFIDNGVSPRVGIQRLAYAVEQFEAWKTEGFP